MSYYPEPDIHIRKKIKAELDLPNYAAKKESEYATYVDTYFNLSAYAAKKDSEHATATYVDTYVNLSATCWCYICRFRC